MPERPGEDRWTIEEIAPGERHCHRVLAEVAVVDSEFQRIEVLETQGFGRGLFLDGRIQHVAADEYIYSESMVHPAMQMRGGVARRVLCIGAGPGGIVRELLGYPGVNEVVQVEIDLTVVNLAREHLAAVGGSFWLDPRYQLKVVDALEYLAADDPPFDLIINDLSEPLPGSPAARLFMPEAIRLVRSRLGPAGLYVSWCGSVGPMSSDLAVRIYQVVRQVFGTALGYLTHPQSYGTVWLTCIGSTTAVDPLALPPQQLDEQLTHTYRGQTRLYDGITHHHMFLLPKDVRTALRRPAETGEVEPITLRVRTEATNDDPIRAGGLRFGR